MYRLFLPASIICIIIGVANIFNAAAFYGASMLFAGVCLYVIFRMLGGSTVERLFHTLSEVHEYRTPGEVYEAGCLLEDHKSGRNLDTGCTVYITQKVMDSDYSVELNAKTLLNSNDPSIKVVDLR